MLLRNRHLLQGRIRKPVFTFETSITAFREQCEKSASRYSTFPPGISVRPLTVAGMKAEWLVPEGSDEGRVILYVHGGGYVSGSCNDHRGFVSSFAAMCGFRCLVYEYRLAPEFPFPAAVEDSVAAYRWLLSEGYRPENILFTGESAGGGLALALLLALKQKNIPLPVAAVAVSPWTDLTCSGDSYRTKNRYSLAPTDSWTVFSRHYTGSHRADDPLVSPLFGDLKGLPPLFVNAGTDDELFDDGREFCRKAKEAGVNVTFRAGEGMVHCFPFLAPMFPEATRAMEEICCFIRERLGK